jgi:hypothetical protein
MKREGSVSLGLVPTVRSYRVNAEVDLVIRKRAGPAGLPIRLFSHNLGNEETWMALIGLPMDNSKFMLDVHPRVLNWSLTFR